MASERKVGWVNEVITFVNRLASPGSPDPGFPLGDLVDTYARLWLPVASLQQGIARSLMKACKAWHNPDLASSDPRTYAGAMGLGICRYVHLGGHECRVWTSGQPK